MNNILKKEKKEKYIRVSAFVVKNVVEKKSALPCLSPQDWYYESQKNGGRIGFICIRVGTTDRFPAPNFIPFPVAKQAFTIGKDGDIALSPWDVDKGLYQKNVEIEYHPFPESMWTIRSLKGVRRGAKEITVNGKTISSSSSKVVIKNGDDIGIGMFEFIFSTNIKDEFEQFEDAKVIIENIERSMKQYIEQHSEIEIPIYLTDELTGEDGEVGLQNAYLRHYRKIFRANWQQPCLSKLRGYYKTKASLDTAFIEMNKIRNIVFHPSKPAILPVQKGFLVDFYLGLMKIGIV